MKKPDITNIISETFQLIYDVSTPSANFQVLYDEAEKDSSGRRIIPFDDYEIQQTLCDGIIENQIKKYKMNQTIASRFRTSIYLGPSPKFIP